MYCQGSGSTLHLSANCKTLYKLAPSFIFLASSVSIFTGYPTPQARGAVCCSHNVFFFSSTCKLCLLPPYTLSLSSLSYCPLQAAEGRPSIPRDVMPCSPVVLTCVGVFTLLPSHHLILCLLSLQSSDARIQEQDGLLFFFCFPLSTPVSQMIPLTL